MICRLNRITDRAKSNTEEVFNNLFSAISVDLLRQTFYRLERGKATGIDDQTVEQYEADLLALRISDPRMLRLIQRFLKAGVMIAGHFEETEQGVPQGAVLSPLLANVYLHYVLDLWFDKEVKPRLSGEATMVRYADDFICTFELERDARRFQEVLKKRLGR